MMVTLLILPGLGTFRHRHRGRIRKIQPESNPNPTFQQNTPPFQSPNFFPSNNPLMIQNAPSLQTQVNLLNLLRARQQLLLQMQLLNRKKQEIESKKHSTQVNRLFSVESNPQSPYSHWLGIPQNQNQSKNFPQVASLSRNFIESSFPINKNGQVDKENASVIEDFSKIDSKSVKKDDQPNVESILPAKIRENSFSAIQKEQIETEKTQNLPSQIKEKSFPILEKEQVDTESTAFLPASTKANPPVLQQEQSTEVQTPSNDIEPQEKTAVIQKIEPIFSKAKKQANSEEKQQKKTSNDASKILPQKETKEISLKNVKNEADLSKNQENVENKNEVENVTGVTLEPILEDDSFISMDSEGFSQNTQETQKKKVEQKVKEKSLKNPTSFDKNSEKGKKKFSMPSNDAFFEQFRKDTDLDLNRLTASKDFNPFDLGFKKE